MDGLMAENGIFCSVCGVCHATFRLRFVAFRPREDPV